MKTIVRIAAISGSLFIGSTTFAQEGQLAAPAKTVTESTPAQAQPMPASTARPQDGWKAIPLGQLVKQVGLTPEQTEKGKVLNATYMKAYQSLDPNMPLETRKVEVKKLMDKRDAELKAMLTPEQLEKYATMREPSGAVKTSPKTMATEKPKSEAKPAPAEQKK